MQLTDSTFFNIVNYFHSLHTAAFCVMMYFNNLIDYFFNLYSSPACFICLYVESCKIFAVLCFLLFQLLVFSAMELL